MVVHPEVGKWLIGFGEKLFGFTPLGWRVVPAVVGALMILVMIRFARRLTGSTLLGCIAGVLLAFDGLEFVLSRLALLDIFVAFFMLCAVHCLVLDRDWYRARMADHVPVQIADARAWGPVRALLFRPVAAGLGHLLGPGARQQVGGGLPARRVRAAGGGVVRRRAPLVRGEPGPGQGAGRRRHPRVRAPRRGRVRRLRRHLDRLADALQPVRAVPRRHAVHPLRLRRGQLRTRHHLRQRQALARPRRQGRARAGGTRAGAGLAGALPP